MLCMKMRKNKLYVISIKMILTLTRAADPLVQEPYAADGALLLKPHKAIVRAWTCFNPIIIQF